MMQFESRRPEPAPPSGKCGKCGQSKPRTRNQGTDRRRIAHRFPRLKRTDREKTQGPGRPRKAEVWEGCGQSPPRTRGPKTTQERIAHGLSTPVRAPISARNRNPRKPENQTAENRSGNPRDNTISSTANRTGGRTPDSPTCVEPNQTLVCLPKCQYCRMQHLDE